MAETVADDANVVSETQQTVINEMQMEASQIVVYAQQFGAAQMIGGAVIASHLPVVSWITLSYVFALPTVVVLQHPDWLHRLRKNHCVALPVIVFALCISDLYALYCLSRLL
jgi:riboflavin transporter FmnP